MIQLTPEESKELDRPDATPPRVMNPSTQETFALLTIEEYERLKAGEYDDSPWTSEERHALAWDAELHAGCGAMDEYDDVPEQK